MSNEGEKFWIPTKFVKCHDIEIREVCGSRREFSEHLKVGLCGEKNWEGFLQEMPHAEF